MEIIDNMRKKVRDATLSALKASSDLIEISKINMAINSEEQKIKSLMFEMGREVYESYKQGEAVDSELAEMCEEIARAEMDIEDMKLKILEIKNLKRCSGCSAEIDEDYAYCPKCGKKVETEKVNRDEEEEESETASEYEDEDDAEDEMDTDTEEDDE
ncbi:hypothetical protein V6C42_10225 [Pseudoclostridium thermosuccinogenes]|uniref:hypothetical protein n=1 Tax=Clostridium thermosuccinogenes TaxID=84032 RepID=UPI002FDA990E